MNLKLLKYQVQLKMDLNTKKKIPLKTKVSGFWFGQNTSVNKGSPPFNVEKGAAFTMELEDKPLMQMFQIRHTPMEVGLCWTKP